MNLLALLTDLVAPKPKSSVQTTVDDHVFADVLATATRDALVTPSETVAALITAETADAPAAPPGAAPPAELMDPEHVPTGADRGTMTDAPIETRTIAGTESVALPSLGQTATASLADSGAEQLRNIRTADDFLAAISGRPRPAAQGTVAPEAPVAETETALGRTPFVPMSVPVIAPTTAARPVPVEVQAEAEASPAVPASTTPATVTTRPEVEPHTGRPAVFTAAPAVEIIPASAPARVFPATGQPSAPVAPTTDDGMSEPHSLVATSAPTPSGAPVAAAPIATVPVAAAPAAQPVVHANARALLPQVAPRIAQAVHVVQTTGGGHELKINVAPEGLGPVTVKVQLTDGSVRVEVTSATEAGRSALHAMTTDLRRDLAVIAGTSHTTSFAVGDSSAGGGQPGAGSSGSGSAPDHSGRAPSQQQPGGARQHARDDVPQHSPRPDTHDTDASLDVVI